MDSCICSQRPPKQGWELKPNPNQKLDGRKSKKDCGLFYFQDQIQSVKSQSIGKGEMREKMSIWISEQSARIVEGQLAITDLADNLTRNLPCHNADPELFFSESIAEVAQAKSLCASCPARLACLQGALSRGEASGIWGGEIFDEGRPVRAKRRAGRPSFASIAADRALAAGLQEDIAALAS